MCLNANMERDIMELIILENNTPLTTSLIIAKETENEHRSIYRMIKRYEEDLKEFGVLRFRIAKPKTGRPLEFAFLNEEQTSLLIMYLQNTQKVRFFKKMINKQFHVMKKALLELKIGQQNEEWIKTRKDGKIARKEYTDMLQKLVDITKENNPESTYSKKPNLLYSNFTKMVYNNLFNTEIKSKKLREYMNCEQLSILNIAELSISKKIYKYLDEKKDAKEIFRLLGEEIKDYIKFTGKSSIIDFMLTKQIKLEDLEK